MVDILIQYSVSAMLHTSECGYKYILEHGRRRRRSTTDLITNNIRVISNGTVSIYKLSNNKLMVQTQNNTKLYDLPSAGHATARPRLTELLSKYFHYL